MSAALWWIVLGFAAVIAELFLTSFIVVFFGAAAILVGMAIWLGLSLLILTTLVMASLS